MAALFPSSHGRQDQPPSQLLHALIHSEPGTVGGDLEQRATRLLEVHRLEPEAIDHRGGMPASRLKATLDCQLGAVVRDTPGDMVDAAGSPGALPFRRRLLDVQYPTRAAAWKGETAPSVLLSHFLESQRAGQKVHCGCGTPFEQPHAMQAADLPRLGNRALLPRSEFALVGCLDQHEREAVRIRKAQYALTEANPDLTACTPWASSRSAQYSRAPIGTASATSTVSPTPVRPGAMSGQGKKVRSVPAMGEPVGVKQMIGTRHILVDRLLDQSHPHDARVEVEVLLSIARDHRDVMQAGNGVIEWPRGTSPFRRARVQSREYSPGPAKAKATEEASSTRANS